MNQNQRKYALERIDAIKAERVRKAHETHTVPAKRLSENEQWDLIVKGKVKLNMAYEPSRFNVALSTIFDFGDLMVHQHISEAGLAKAAQITALAQEAKDAIMLGDSTEALAAIAKFDKDSA